MADGGSGGLGWFAGSRRRFDELVRFLEGEQSAGFDHARVETRLDRDGRELLRQTEGCLRVALWGGSAIHGYTPDGRPDKTIEVPVEQVTSCAFVDSDLDKLVITTAREGTGHHAPLAGALFVPTPAFAEHRLRHFPIELFSGARSLRGDARIIPGADGRPHLTGPSVSPGSSN